MGLHLRCFSPRKGVKSIFRAAQITSDNRCSVWSPCSAQVEISLVRKADVSPPFLEPGAEAADGLADDEQTGVTTGRGLDRGSGGSTRHGVLGVRFGYEFEAGLATGDKIRDNGGGALIPQVPWPAGTQQALHCEQAQRTWLMLVKALRMDFKQPATCAGTDCAPELTASTAAPVLQRHTVTLTHLPRGKTCRAYRRPAVSNHSP